MADRFSCARHSRALEEPLLGTASTVKRWLLVEQPGSWGADALLESGMERVLGVELKRRARAARARPLLIRRHDGDETQPRTAYVVSSVAGWVERIHFEQPEELLDLDLDPLRRDEPVGGEAVDAPLLLTCTNGRHDACCAEMGRPVAAALDGAAGEHAWEVSHIGGDRFAANVLWLPAGVYYGRVEAEDAPRLAALAATGRISLPHYRGRSVLPFSAQAAEMHLREHLRTDRLDDLLLESFDDGGGRVRVVFAHGERRFAVGLSVVPAPEAQQLTCRAPRAMTPARYRDVEVRELTAGVSG